MSFLSRAQEEPWLFDFFTMLRRLERSYRDRPRIGDGAALREEFVALGQDPYMDFPASNLSKVDVGADGRLQVLVRFLGLLGPQGALPLATTEEAYGWWLARDDAFARFLDIINNRFLQLFYRAWADARPIVQHDRPQEDRFIAYIGSVIGLGSPPYRNLDSVPDEAKLAFAGLMGAQAKGASRLRGLISGMFGVRAEIAEFVGSYLPFEEAERTRIGARNSALGIDMLVGASIFSVQDKFRIRIYVRNMEEYARFLPSGPLCEPLNDIVFFDVGEQLDWEVELAIPRGAIEPARIGTFGQLGWTTWMAPAWARSDEAYRTDARFHPAEILKQRREGTPPATH
jgi:type VI secretion system protein ImpH